MNVIGIVIWIALIAVFGALVVAAITLFLKEGLIEVGPKRAVVYKNIWTGKPDALLPGMHQIIPGKHKKLIEVTLENEPSDPSSVTVITSDGTEIDVDYVIYTQQVAGGKIDEEDIKKAVVKVGTEINYEKRRELAIDRIKARFQDYFSGVPIEDILSRDIGKVNKKLIEEAEGVVNKYLEKDIEDQWGLKVEIQVQNIRPPEKLSEVAEEAASAEREGERIKVKAEKAGIKDARWVLIGDALYDVARIFLGTGVGSGGGKR